MPATTPASGGVVHLFNLVYDKAYMLVEPLPFVNGHALVNHCLIGCECKRKPLGCELDKRTFLATSPYIFLCRV